MFSCLILSLMTALPIKADEPFCPEGMHQIGTSCNLIVMPDQVPWNHDLVVFAHGYISPAIKKPMVVDYEIPPGSNQTVSKILTGLGYAFATTSYSSNGLAIPQAVEDIRALTDYFLTQYPETNHIYLVGASEGGLVTALALERNPGIFDGGLAICGPVGNFRKQINYLGDFLVLFNYFFPDFWEDVEVQLQGIPELGPLFVLEKPTPAGIPDVLVNQDVWDGIVAPMVVSAIQSDPSAKRQLLRVANAPANPDDPLSKETILGVLWYGIFATNDAIVKLDGGPYDNSRRWYFGSRNDWRLNWRIDRFCAETEALDNIESGLQASGRLSDPLVTLHTTQDPIVPYWHETLYNLKTLFGGSLLYHLNIPVVRYGHCAFTEQELLTAFAIMLFMSGGY
ncbi:MAG: alpha/beta hydrolase [Acidobacteria bacterium]|nr:alpha/beta hydrolase [Acidobacteriota bacterium]